MYQVPDSFVHWFRFAAPYLRKHRDATIVIALPGELIGHDNFLNVVHDLALLQSLGARLVIVQGARKQIDQALTQAGIELSFHNNIRISTSAAMPHVVSAANNVRTELESAMSAGLLNSPLHQLNLKTLSGNFVSAKPFGVHDGVDYQCTGLVRQVDSNALNAALDTGAAVLINTLGYSSTGEIFNLAINDCLVQISRAVKADKLLCFTSTAFLEPLLEKTVVSPETAHTYANHSDYGSDLIDSLALAVDQGLDRAHVISFESDGALLKELFTHDGAGLLISADPFSAIRPARAEDIGGILELIQPLQESGALIQRTRDLLEQEIDNFAVLDIDGTVVGCAALHLLEDDYAELACIAVHAEFRGRGHAENLLKYQENRARALDVKQLFALSTQAGHWFIDQGFIASGRSALPPVRQQLYDNGRSSKVYLKSI